MVGYTTAFAVRFPKKCVWLVRTTQANTEDLILIKQAHQITFTKYTYIYIYNEK